MTRARFLRRLALYIAPFAVVFLGWTGALVYTGESLPLRLVVEAQRGGEPVLYRPRYGNRDLAFKRLAVEVRQPDVIALGSSRVLQMRGAFFDRQPDAFYNAGAPAWTLDHVEAFVTTMEHTPRLLILGLDHVWFNDAYPGDPHTPALDADTSDWAHVFSVNRSLMQDVLGGGTFDVGALLARREPGYGGLALGLRAIRDGHGFRSDGSEQYGDFLIAHFLWQENERQRHLDLLRDGREMYVPGATVSETRLAQLDRLLAVCAERGIVVVGFTPPFMPTLYAQMRAGGQHPYADALIPRLDALFAAHGFAFADYSDGGAPGLDATDSDFFDGWHASERIYLRLYIDLSERYPDLFDPYTDADALRRVAADAADTFAVFPP